ncbi:MAG: TonB C-terminal domain-containing protein [Neisseriales bacterium]|nr:MAG: TonB C-terminal domain-containing protein [Neisseriales bacterium]
MSTIYQYSVSPRWPLIASILLHMCLIGLLLLYHDRTTISAETAPQSVELWLPAEIMENIHQKNPNIQPTQRAQQSTPPLKGDISLPSSAMAQHNIVRTTPPTAPKQSISLPSAHRTVEAALSTLRSQSLSHPSQSTTMPSASDMRAYKIQVIRRIRPYIRIPQSLVGNPTAQVQVRLTRSMEIIFVKLIQSSGNGEYDQSILQAIQKVGQLPRLPVHADPYAWRSITLTFRPHE